MHFERTPVNKITLNPLDCLLVAGEGRVVRTHWDDK